MLDGDGREPLGNAVQRLDAIEPVALCDAFLQIEAGRGRVARCAPPFDRLDRHAVMLSLSKNKSRTSARPQPVEDQLPMSLKNEDKDENQQDQATNTDIHVTLPCLLATLIG